MNEAQEFMNKYNLTPKELEDSIIDGENKAKVYEDWIHLLKVTSASRKAFFEIFFDFQQALKGVISLKALLERPTQQEEIRLKKISDLAVVKYFEGIPQEMLPEIASSMKATIDEDTLRILVTGKSNDIDDGYEYLTSLVLADFRGVDYNKVIADEAAEVVMGDARKHLDSMSDKQ